MIEKCLAENNLTIEDLTAEELEALKEEIQQQESGCIILDGVLSNPEIFYRKALKTVK